MEYHELNVERDFCKKRLLLLLIRKQIMISEFFISYVNKQYNVPKRSTYLFLGQSDMKYGSMFPCSCLIVFQLIDLLDWLYIQIYTTEMVLSVQSSVAGRFVFVKAVDKQCIYIYVFVHYLSVLLQYVVSFWQGQFMMTYVKQYTLLDLVMLNYLNTNGY